MGTTGPPAVVPGAGVGLVPLVTVAAGEADPRSILVPVTAISVSNAQNSIGSSTSNNGTNTNSNSGGTSMTNVSPNTAAMEQAEDIIKLSTNSDGEVYLEVECGQNKAAMYLKKLCQGSKGPCIDYQGSWLTPNEFQFVSGRETAKDWKRSIRHHGKSLKLLLSKGILNVHPTMCDCEGCRIGAVLTRKGEKRRIPNGERKRKSPGSVPENFGTGTFRPAGGSSGGVKTPDGTPDSKRIALDKCVEGAQSPLKESSVMNLPEAKDEPALRLAESHVSAVHKMAVSDRFGFPMIPSGVAGGMTNDGAMLSPSEPCQVKDTSSPSKAKSQQSTDPADTVVTDSDTSASQVTVLSSSSPGASGASSLDKSMSRLALHQAVCASVKGQVSFTTKSQDLCSAPKGDAEDVPESDDTSSENGPAKTYLPSKKELSDAPPVNEMKAVAETAACNEIKGEQVGLPTEHWSSGLGVGHSMVAHTKSCELNNNNSSTSRMGVNVSCSSSSPSSVAAATSTSPAVISQAPEAETRTALTQPTDSHVKQMTVEDKSLACSTATSLAAISPSIESRFSGTEKHVTIRHPSPERRPQAEPVPRTSHIKYPKESSAEKTKDRKHEVTSSSSPTQWKEKQMKDKASPSSRTSHERDMERRRTEERSERDRKSLGTSGQNRHSEDVNPRGPEFSAVGNSRPEGLAPTAPVPPVPIPAQVADAAAFSDYIRLLAAGHNSLVPPPPGCLPPYALRQPADMAALSSGLMHPMHAASACGIFSPPSSFLANDPSVYPAAAGPLPNVPYGYGTSMMPPVSLLAPQYSSAAPNSMLDYSRPFPYFPWPAGLPLAMPDAMTAAASSSAKRSREEMEAGMDMASKRLQFPVSPYGVTALSPMDYMAAYRSFMTPMASGLETSVFDKNADYQRKRMYPDLAGSVMGGSKGIDSPYMASLPDYYRALYSCRCLENRPEDIRTWDSDAVVKLVSTTEGCSAYSETFRDQRVNGRIVVLLTRESLIKNLGMKLAPAMTLTSRVAKVLLDSIRASGCESCHRLASMVPVVQSAMVYP